MSDLHKTDGRRGNDAPAAAESTPGAGAPNGAAPAAMVDDEKMFTDLVRHHGGRMLAVARRIVGDEAAAHDCVQDAFLNAYRGGAGFAGRSSIGTWLHRIVVNEALQQLRRRRGFREESIETASGQFDAEGCRIDDRAQSLRLAEAVFEGRERRARVRRAIAGLPISHRTILVLRDIEGYDTAETAALLDLSPAAAKVRLHRARLALKDVLLADLATRSPAKPEDSQT